MFKGSDWKVEFEKFNKQWEKEGYLSMDELKDFISKQISEAYQQGYSEGSLNQSKMQEKLLKNASDNSYQQGKEEERERTSSEMSKIHPVIHSDSNCALCAIRNFLKSSTV